MASEHAPNSSMAPWAVASWPEVEYYLPKHRSCWPQFRQGGVSFECQPEGSPQTGSSVWVAELAGKHVGLAWDWMEIRPGVVALVDPNGIISNLRFLRDEDHFESPATTCVAVTRMVCALPWQAGVRSELLAARSTSRPSRKSDAGSVFKSVKRPDPILAGPLRAPAIHCRV